MIKTCFYQKIISFTNLQLNKYGNFLAKLLKKKGRVAKKKKKKPQAGGQ